MIAFQASDYFISGVALLVGCWACLNTITLPRAGSLLGIATRVQKKWGNAAARCFWAVLAILMFAIAGAVILDIRPEYARPTIEQPR